jgi:hypothetical protein
MSGSEQLLYRRDSSSQLLQNQFEELPSNPSKLWGFIRYVEDLTNPQALKDGYIGERYPFAEKINKVLNLGKGSTLSEKNATALKYEAANYPIFSSITRALGGGLTSDSTRLHIIPKGIKEVHNTSNMQKMKNMPANLPHYADRVGALAARKIMWITNAFESTYIIPAVGFIAAAIARGVIDATIMAAGYLVMAVIGLVLAIGYASWKTVDGIFGITARRDLAILMKHPDIQRILQEAKENIAQEKLNGKKSSPSDSLSHIEDTTSAPRQNEEIYE